jgi:hypothetical protein
MVDHFPEGLDALRGKDLPAHIPVKLITAGDFPLSADVWRECHEEMVRESEMHEMIIAEGNGHDILDENPILVLNTIAGLCEYIQSQ